MILYDKIPIPIVAQSNFKVYSQIGFGRDPKQDDDIIWAMPFGETGLITVRKSMLPKKVYRPIGFNSKEEPVEEESQGEWPYTGIQFVRKPITKREIGFNKGEERKEYYREEQPYRYHPPCVVPDAPIKITKNLIGFNRAEVTDDKESLEEKVIKGFRR